MGCFEGEGQNGCVCAVSGFKQLKKVHVQGARLKENRPTGRCSFLGPPCFKPHVFPVSLHSEMCRCYLRRHSAQSCQLRGAAQVWDGHLASFSFYFQLPGHFGIQRKLLIYGTVPAFCGDLVSAAVSTCHMLLCWCASL